MTPKSHPAGRLGLVRRFCVVVAVYALVMQAAFAAAVAAQAAAWGGAGAAVICRGATQPGDTSTPLPEHHAADCLQACAAAAAGAAVIPAAVDGLAVAAWVSRAETWPLTRRIVAAAQDRDGDARAPPMAALRASS
jgi:hypothetical protein